MYMLLIFCLVCSGLFVYILNGNRIYIIRRNIIFSDFFLPCLIQGLFFFCFILTSSYFYSLSPSENFYIYALVDLGPVQ
jgi:hypothetical protein